MENILKNTKGLTYETKNSFNNGSAKCYYKETLNGFVVFFLFNGIVDLGFYNKKKEQISFVISVSESIKEDWQEQFIDQIIKD